MSFPKIVYESSSLWMGLLKALLLFEIEVRKML